MTDDYYDSLIGKPYYLMAWFEPFQAAHDWEIESKRHCCKDFLCLSNSAHWKGFDNLEDAVSEKLKAHFPVVLVDATKSPMHEDVSAFIAMSVESHRASQATKAAAATLKTSLAAKGIIEPE